MSIRRVYRSVAVAMSVGLIASLGGLAVAAPAHAVATLTPSQSVVPATVGVAITDVTFTPDVLAGTLGYTISPAQPAGMSFSTVTGVLSGTPSVASASTTYLITATDTDATTAQASVSITVAGTLAAAPEGIVGTAGLPIASPLILTPAGLTGLIAYAASPPLPAGLTIGADGVVAGTPTSASPLTTHVVTATDANGATAKASITSLISGPLSTTAATRVGEVGRPLATVTFGVAGWAGVTYATTPALPGGLSISPEGVLSGTPNAAVAQTGFDVVATSTGVGFATTTITLTIGSLSPAQQILAARVGVPIAKTQVLVPAGLSPSPAFAASLPAGLSIDAATGVVSGIPTTATDAADVTITATDTAGVTATSIISISVAKAQLDAPAIYFAQAGTTPGSLRVLFTGSLNAPTGQVYAAEVYDATGATLLRTVRPLTSLTEITGLTAGTSYQVVVVADGSANYLEARSAPKNGIASQVGSKLTPPTITAISGGSVAGSLAVSFTLSPNAPTGQTYSARVYDEDQTSLVTSVNRVTSPVQITGLTPGMSYYVVISADASPGFLEALSRGRLGVATAAGGLDSAVARPTASAATPTTVVQAPSRAMVPVKLGGGWFIIPTDSSSKVKRVVVTQRPSSQSASAPAVRVRANRVVSLRVKGLPANALVVAEVFLKGQWVSMGGVRANAKGVVDLPAFKVTKAGRSLMRLTSMAQPSGYLSVAVKARA